MAIPHYQPVVADSSAGASSSASASAHEPEPEPEPEHEHASSGDEYASSNDDALIRDEPPDDAE